MAEATYYWAGLATGGWEGDPQKMYDGLLATFAYSASAGDLETLALSNCPGTDLGTITKVEIRVYGYGDGDDRIDLTPSRWDGEWKIFDEHQLTMPGSEGWSAYADITNDTNAPSPWQWSDIADANFRCIVEYDKVGKGNTMYCAKVEIRVTYTPGAPPSYPYHRYTLKAGGSGRRGFDETTGHRRGFWP